MRNKISLHTESHYLILRHASDWLISHIGKIANGESLLTTPLTTENGKKQLGLCVLLRNTTTPSKVTNLLKYCPSLNQPSNTEKLMNMAHGIYEFSKTEFSLPDDFEQLECSKELLFQLKKILTNSSDKKNEAIEQCQNYLEMLEERITQGHCSVLAYT